MRADHDDTASALLDGLTFDTLLKALVRGRGFDAALRDPPGRRSWSDTIPTSLAFAQLEERIDQLGRLLAINRASPGATVAIFAPLGGEAIVAILASLRAGLSPLMLPLHASDAELLRLMETSGAVMALSVGRVGSLRPLLTLRDLAVKTFCTRFVGGFGQDVPDGVAALDRLMASGGLHALPVLAERAALQVVDAATPARIERISERDIMAKALELSRLLKPLTSSRIVTTLVGGDLAALASGPGMAMLTGVELLPLGLFDLGDLQACIAGGRNIHLVVPGTMEPALARSRLAADPALASLVFIHRVEDDRALPALDRPDLAIVDVDVRSPAGIEISRR